MHDHAPSATALRVAALRALHQTADVPPIFVDPLAERILGPESADLLARYRETARETARLRGTLAARAVIAEESIREAVSAGCSQCVILGAGLDTFAYRHDHAGLRVIEVDHPATQQWKRDRLAAAEIAIPGTVAYAAAHFEREDLVSALMRAGFEPSRPAVFAMLGVVPYVESARLLDMLGRIASEVVRGTRVVFDYTEPYHDAPEPVRATYDGVAKRVAASGEPWITFFEPGPLDRMLRDRGYVDVTDLDAEALQRRFCEGRPDGMTIAPLVHLVKART